MVKTPSIGKSHANRHFPGRVIYGVLSGLWAKVHVDIVFSTVSDWMKAKTEPDPTPKPFPKPAPTPMSGWLQIVSVAALCAYAVAVCWMVSRMKLPPEKPTANLLREGVQHAQEALADEVSALQPPE